MSITQLFVKLGARLRNQVWSWGAVRPSDNAVVLRVWQDECRKINGRHCARITAYAQFASDPDNDGWRERQDHLARLQEGAPCYLVMCDPVDPQARSRALKGFNEKEVFVGGALVESDGDWWIELADRMPYQQAMPVAATHH